MKVYKIVRISVEGYVSLFAPVQFLQVYKIGEETKADPNTLGLMVFRAMEDAVEFRTVNRLSPGEQLILKCDAKGVSKGPILLIGRTVLECMLSFYEGLRGDGNTATAPSGTYTCESLIPEEVVPKKKFRRC